MIGYQPHRPTYWNRNQALVAHVKRLKATVARQQIQIESLEAAAAQASLVFTADIEGLHVTIRTLEADARALADMLEPMRTVLYESDYALINKHRTQEEP